jgi:hypothetical protein
MRTDKYESTKEPLKNSPLCTSAPLCGDLFIKKFTTEGTEVHRGVLGMEVFQRFPKYTAGSQEAPFLWQFQVVKVATYRGLLAQSSTIDL